MRKLNLLFLLCALASCSEDKNSGHEAGQDPTPAPAPSGKKHGGAEDKPKNKLPEEGDGFEFVDPVSNRKVKGSIDIEKKTVTIHGKPLALQAELINSVRNTNLGFVMKDGDYSGCERYSPIPPVSPPFLWEAGWFRLLLSDPIWPEESIAEARKQAVKVNTEAEDFAYRGEEIVEFGISEDENSSSKHLGGDTYSQLQSLGKKDARLLNGSFCDLMLGRLRLHAFVGSKQERPVRVNIKGARN